MKKLSVCLLSIFILLTLSCEIGLGSAVDTEAPTLEIANPPSDAIIRDSFAVSGSWKDDGSISSVTMEMVRLDNNKRVSFEGTFADPPERGADGSWQVVINPKEAGLLDGTYEALVAISDNGGHTTTMARSFTIDNTPPVMLLSRPSTKVVENGSFDSYGQSFTLEGKAADDNDVSLIEVNIYETPSSTTPLKTVELKNIPLTIEQNVAVFKSNEANAYSAIYGHTDSNGIIKSDERNFTEERYCTITIYDGAERYPVDGSAQTDADKKGNSTNSYYMNSEMTTILSDYKITDLYHILNGSLTDGSGRSAAPASIKQQLSQKAISKSQFSLNPANNPHFVVTSRNALNGQKTLDNPEYQLTAGNSQIEVEVTPGLDKFPILSNTVGVYLYECDENGVIIETDGAGNPKQPICLFEPGAHKVEAYVDSIPLTNQVIIVQSGDTYKFKTVKVLDKNNYAGLSVGSYYRIEVVGNDSQGVEKGKIVSNGIYAFKLISSGDIIELSGQASPDYISKYVNDTGVSDAWNIPGHENLTVTLTWRTGQGPFDVYKKTGNETEAVKVNTTPITIQTIEDGEPVWQFTDTIPCTELAQKGFPGRLKYHLKNSSGGADVISTEANVIIRYDNELPNISNINFTNSYIKEEITKDANNNDVTKITYYVKNDNGKTCEISGIATDETGIEKVELIIPGLTPQQKTDARFKFPGINFSTLSNRVTATITATDVAGNQTSEDLSVIFDITPPARRHEIDAKGKDLFFRIGDGNNGAGSKYSKDSFGNANTIKIRGNFDDTKYHDDPENPTEETLHNLPADSGSGVKLIYYKVFTSENENESNNGPTAAQLANFALNYDSDGKDGKIKADGYFAPLENPKTYTVSKNLEGGTTDNKEIVSNFEATIGGFNNTTNYLSLVVVDNVGNSALDCFKIDDVVYKSYLMNNDTENPEITPDEQFSNNQYVNSTLAHNLVIFGTASDNAAGVDSITVNVNGKSITKETDLNGTEFGTIQFEATDDPDRKGTQGNWHLEIKPSVFADVNSGNVSVYATTKDKAGTGNSQTVTIATVTVDKRSPDVEIRTPCKANDTGVSVNKKIDISGIASDTNQIQTINGIYYKYKLGEVLKPADNTTEEVLISEGSGNNAGWTKLEDYTAVGTTSWNFKDIDTTLLPESVQGHTISITVAASDMAGNIGYAEPIKVTVDQNSDRPIINLSQILEKTDSQESTLKTNNVFGSIKDDDGSVLKFWYWSAQKNKSAANPTGAPTESPNASDNKGWEEIHVDGNSWSIDSTEDDGETTWYFAVQDGSGTIFSTIETDQLKRPYIFYKDADQKLDNSDGVTFKYDTNPPVVTKLLLARYATVTSGSPKTAQEIELDDENGSVEWSEESKIAFGGNYNVLYAKVLVTEGTGMMPLTGAAESQVTLDTSPITISYRNAANEGLKVKQIASSNEGDNYVYYLGPLIMDTTALHDFKVNVVDDVGNIGTITRTIIVDNTAPSRISNVRPAKGAPQVGVVNLRGGVDDNDDGSGILFDQDQDGNIAGYGVKYYIPTHSEAEALRINQNSITSIAADNWLTPTTPGNSSWEIEFTNLGADIGYNETTYDVSADYKGFETEEGSGLYDIPVWFRLEDKVGNIGYVTDNAITYNPNADRPTVEFTYPKHDKPEGSLNPTYVVVGGTITITGMANDDDGIGSVYLQFDTTGDGSFDNSIVAGAYKEEEVVDIPGLVTNGVQEKGIRATGTKSWYYTMSVTGMSDLNYETDGKTLNVRAVSIENDSEKEDAGKPMLHSAWTKQILHLSINNDVPNFSGIKLKKFSNETEVTASNLNTITAIGEQNYTSEMYIKGDESDGKWYLIGDVEVSSGAIKKIKTTGSSTLNFEVGTAGNTLIACRASGITDDKKYSFAIPIPLNNNVWSIQLYVEDATNGTPATNRSPVTINIDKDAPDFTDKNADGSLIKLYKNAYGTSGVELSLASTNNYIQNSNGGNFTLAGRITEGGSGFDKLAFYFKRTDYAGGNPRVYNPMEGHGADNLSNRTSINTSSNPVNKAVYINADGLPALYLAASEVSRSNLVTIQSEEIKGNKNIRRGGLVKIGGIYRLIDNVEARDTTGTITFTPNCDIGFKEVEFIYAMVVDSNGESEKNGQLKNDDGDEMLESFTKTGSNYTWDATINSKKIPDGPIEIHCVVFDKAGNVRHGYTKTHVSNNPPRITSVKLGTDLNNDSKYALDSEFVTHYANEDRNTSSGKDVWNLDTRDSHGKYWTAKNGLVVIPEFVGGTGNIYYRYDKHVGESAEAPTTAANGTIAGTATLKKLLTSQEETSTIVSTTGGSAATLTASNTENKIGAIILANAANDDLTHIGWTNGEKNGDNSGVNLYSFSFWDSTEECVVGSDTQWSLLNASFVQDIIDNTPPEGFIKPFYWNSRTNNSLADNNPSNGHIELESDLKEVKNAQGNKIFTASGSEVFDLDPKVSGKIKIEGEASDETLLKTIKVSFDGNSVTATFTPENRTGGNNGWSYDANTDDFSLSITDTEGSTQTGHSVIWVYTVDTSKISNVVNTDREIKVEVTDARGADGGNKNTVGSISTAAGEGNQTAFYRVDVVPYITEIDTELSKSLKSSIKSAYSRTTLGHYIVRSNESVILKGFNLGNSSVSPKYGNTSLTLNSEGNAELPVSLITTSGEVSITVNDIQILNNLNNNNACGSYKTETTEITEDSSYDIKNTYAYNRMPNRTSNNLLTDDVVIDIWEFDSDAAKPMSGELREPSMKINPVTGQLGLAFVSGPANISMADDNNSYTKWQQNFATYNNISFTYDALGKAHATATGLDTNPNDKHAGRFSYFYSPWGTSGITDQTGNYAGVNAIRLESIAVPYVPGTQTNLDLTGAYLKYLNNEKIYEKKNSYRIVANGNLIDPATFGELTETRFYSPSLTTTMHGTDESATVSVYLAYYDSIQKQIRFRYNSEVSAEWSENGTSSNKDDFVDNTGYYYNNKNKATNSGKTGKYQDYMEASTENFSLIAGIDTQKGTENYIREVSAPKDFNVTKTDAEGNSYYIMNNNYRRIKEIKEGNLLDDDGNKDANIIKLTITEDIWNKLHVNLQTREELEIGKEVSTFKRTYGGKDYFWIIQPDGLIYYSADNPNREDQGHMTHVAIELDIHDYTFSNGNNKGRKFDPDVNYTVYKRVEETDGYKYAAPAANQSQYFWPSANKVATVAIPGYWTEWYSSYDTGYTGYKYVAIDAKSGTDAAHDVVVAVWYDGTNLRYAYNDNPTSGLDNGSEGGWKGNKVIFSEGGEHCTVKLDSEGGVHIAAYVDGSLRYAYLPSVNAGYSEASNSVQVDSFTITGERITLDTGKDAAGNVIPYISYFNGTARLPSVAKLVVPSSGSIDYTAQGTGTSDGEDLFTGNWEISLVPSPKTLTTNYYDKMNICLWKQAGTIVTSKDTRFTVTGGETGKTSNDNSSGTTNGNIYGNGTANPILGYAIESTSGTCLETAQMK